MSSRNRPCPCGSGKRFKHCCGAVGATPAASGSVPPAAGSGEFEEMGRYRDALRGRAMAARCGDMPEGRAPGLAWAPPGLLVVERHLDPATCAEWRRHLQAQPARHATVKDVDPNTGAPRYVRDPQRVTRYVDPGSLAPALRATVVAAYRDTIVPHFGQELDWLEPPAVLRYEPGGKYDGHADNEYWDLPARRWVRSVDRDFSLLLYLNEDYEGGSLYFPNFEVRVRPRTGMLIAFPSDHRYLHAAEPLLSGERYAVVCWATVRGSPRVASTPMQAIFP